MRHREIRFLFAAVIVVVVVGETEKTVLKQLKKNKLFKYSFGVLPPDFKLHDIIYFLLFAIWVVQLYFKNYFIVFNIVRDTILNL